VDYYLESQNATSVAYSPGASTGNPATQPPAVTHHVTTVAPPVPQHVPPGFAVSDRPLPLELRTTCSSANCSAELYYRVTEGDVRGTVLTAVPDWPHTRMTLASSVSLGDLGRELTFTAAVPADSVTTRGVDYFMIITDGDTRSFWPGTAYQGYLPTNGMRTGYAHVPVLLPSQIVHAPVTTSPYRADIPISGTATCPQSRTCTAQLFWRTTTTTVTTSLPQFDSAAMTVTPGEVVGDTGQRRITVSGIVPGSVADTRGVDYFFSVADGETKTWWPGTSHVSGYYSVAGSRVAYQHIRVAEPPHLVPVPVPPTPAGVATTVTTQMTCVTATCTAKLYFADAALENAASLGERDFTSLPMALTASTAAPTVGRVLTFSAQIPANRVTTRGLVYFIEAFDGHVHAYAPGTSYVGHYVPVDGSRLGQPQPVDPQTATTLQQLRGFVDTLAAANDGLAPLRDSSQADIAFPIRVLEPPHIAHVPTLVAGKDHPLDLTFRSNCSYSACHGRVEWRSTDGSWNSTTARGTRLAQVPGGSSGFEFTARIPRQDLASDTQYRLSVSDGYARDTTPTYGVSVNDTINLSGVTGQAWYEPTGDAVRVDGEPGVADLTIEARIAGPDLVLGTADDVAVASTRTDDAGRYRLSGLAPGSYSIAVARPPSGGAAYGATKKTVTLGVAQTVTFDLNYRALDSDNDSVIDIIEQRLGLPVTGGADSDNDGITDRQEIAAFSGVLRPDIADTDADGLADLDEDLDGDTLTNRQELAAGTNPLDRDVDRDGLLDAAERARGTSTTIADSDADGLPDGFEIKAGTNPLAVDSDGDGLRDGLDTTTAALTADNARVSVTGIGPLIDHLSITPVPASSVTQGPGQRGGVREIHLASSVRDGFRSATVTLPYDAGTPNAANLQVFAYHEDLRLWAPASNVQSVNTTARTVTATVNHFSLYAIFDRVEWNATWTGITPIDPRRAQGPADVVLAIDSSGSMADNDPDNERLAAAHAFVAAMTTDDRAAVVDFDESAYVAAPLGSARADLDAAIDLIDANGGTDLEYAVMRSIDELERASRTTSSRSVILITDGEGDYTDAATQRAVAEDIAIFAIDLLGTNEATLRRAAEATGGQYFRIETAASIAAALTDAQNLSRAGDADRDGIDNAYEQEGLKDGLTGDLITSDPLNPDTDGDGLLDGEEARVTNLGAQTAYDTELAYLGTRMVFVAASDPRYADTDSDGLGDYDETAHGTEARLADFDGDLLSDGEEVQANTSPDDADSDNDGRSDRHEAFNLDQGLDPLVRETTQSKLDYVKHFVCGATIGEFDLFFSGCDTRNLAWLAGQIVSGLIAIGDVRDLIVSTLKLDIVGAATSIVGVVPGVGDAVATGTKIGRFALANTDKSDEALRTVRGADGASQAATAALKKIDAGALADLRAAGFSDDAIAKIVTGPISGSRLAELSRLARTHGVVIPDQIGFLPRWQDGETYLRHTYGAGEGVRDSQARLRIVDSVEERPGMPPVFHESKVGYQNKKSFIEKEIQKDCDLLKSGEAQEVIWHFFGSATRSGRHNFGMSGSVQALIDAALNDPIECPGFSIAIYPPAS
jgi:Mg-chelatase subunit ChlD